MVDQRGTGLHCVDNALVEDDFPQVGVISEAGENELLAGNGVRRGVGLRASVLAAPAPRLVGGPVVDRHLVSRLAQPSGHGIPHDTQTQKGDFVWHVGLPLER